MVGKPLQKILCQGKSRQTGKPCRCKGYRTATGLYLCKYHGGQNRFAFNQHNYSDIARINKLKGLKQFRNYDDQRIKEYYYKIQTLVDKMLRIYDSDKVPDQSLILFLRDKQSFLKWIAGKITDIYSDNKVQNIKQDTSLNISWSDGSHIKEIEGIVDEIEQQPPKD